jgi:hypothetical protein
MKIKFKKLTVILLCFLLVLSVTSCGEVKQAQKSMEDMFALLKEGKYDEACTFHISTLGGDNDFLACKGKFNEEDFPAYTMHNELFSTMEYKVLETISSAPAKVTLRVEITTVDLEPVGEQLLNILTEYNYMADNSEIPITEEEKNEFGFQRLAEISHDYLTGSERKNKTSIVDVNIFYEKDQTWKVYPDDTLVNVLTGGAYNKFDVTKN